MTTTEYIIFGVPIAFTILSLIHNYVSIRYMTSAGQLLSTIKMRLVHLDWEDDDVEQTYLPGIRVWQEQVQFFQVFLMSAAITSGILFVSHYFNHASTLVDMIASLWLSAAILMTVQTFKHVYLIHGVVTEYQEMLEAAEEMYKEENEPKQN